MQSDKVQYFHVKCGGVEVESGMKGKDSLKLLKFVLSTSVNILSYILPQDIMCACVEALIGAADVASCRCQWMWLEEWWQEIDARWRHTANMNLEINTKTKWIYKFKTKNAHVNPETSIAAVNSHFQSIDFRHDKYLLLLVLWKRWS